MLLYQIFRKVPDWRDLGYSLKETEALYESQKGRTLNFPWKMTLFLSSQLSHVLPTPFVQEQMVNVQSGPGTPG